MGEARDAAALGDVERPIQLQQALAGFAGDAVDLNARLRLGLRDQGAGAALEGIESGHGRVEGFPKGRRVAGREGLGHAEDEIGGRCPSGQKRPGGQHGQTESVAHLYVL